MASEPVPSQLVYWDANLFIHYAARSPEWIQILDALVSEARSGKIQIATSTLSTVEAAFTPAEKESATLSLEVETAFRVMFEDFTLLRIVDFDRHIADVGRDLMRAVVPSGRSLKPGEAIHVATARVLKADAFFSTDERLNQLCNDFQWCAASTPVSMSPMLPGFSGGNDEAGR